MQIICKIKFILQNLFNAKCLHLESQFLSMYKNQYKHVIIQNFGP